MNTTTLEKSSTSIKGWTKFDSIFESEIYLSLRKHFPLATVQPQFPFDLVPAHPLNRYKKALTWKCDFALTFASQKTIIPVEAKGNWIEANNAAMADFKKTLRLLDLFYPQEARNLIIVSPGKEIEFDEFNKSITIRHLIEKILTAFHTR